MAITSTSPELRPPAVDPHAERAAREAGLRYVSDGVDGYRRVRQRGRFVYLDARGRRVADPAELERIARLAIPPAYEAVWICADPRGHLQATGRDARGRKQYRYHPDWRATRDFSKFARMCEFGEALARLRRRVRADLAAPGLSRDKVLALVVKLLDVTRVRIGNDAYARENGSFGLTTLHSRHLRPAGAGRLRLGFPGKGGAQHDVLIDDPRVAAVVRRCHQLPGQRLFQYLDDAGEPHPVDSGQVNDYLREAMGGTFTAKDFRTWGATSRAIGLLVQGAAPEDCGVRVAKARELEVIRQVATEMRNTPAVCRKSYIDPRAFALWRSGALHRLALTKGARPRRGDRFTLRVLAAMRRLKDAAEPLRRALRASLREGVQASRRGANGSTAEHRDPAQASRRRRSANPVAGARLPV